MSILGFLTSTLGGSVLGWLGHILTSVFELWRKKKEQDLQIELMKVQSEMAVKVKEWEAFTAAQNSLGSTFKVPVHAAPWAASFYTFCEALVRIVRPYLTFIASVLIAVVYLTADPAQRGPLAIEINAGCWLIITFWFGNRYMRKS